MNFSRKQLAICLVIIGVVSLIPKLYSIDFSQPLGSDETGFALHAFYYSTGHFAVTPKQQPGWSLLISLFYHLTSSNKFIDYENTVRILSVVVSTISILPMYMLARRFFDEKYSLVASALLAFEPHLNRWAPLGYAEPLYNLVIILSLYFILVKDSRRVLISFVLAGILWWIRPNGIVMIFLISLIFIINFRRSPSFAKNLTLGIILFLIVISPILIQRYNQYGDPFYVYYGSSIFAGSEQQMIAENYDHNQFGLSEYVKQHGVVQFLSKFIVGGAYKIIEGSVMLSFPFMIILLPFGILFSLRPLDQEKKHILANWIVILGILCSLAIPYAVIQEYRFLFSLLPFFVVFSVIPIQRVTQYGLSTFSFSAKQKNLFLIIVIGIIFVLGGLFLLRYEKIDKAQINEEIEFAKILQHDYHGRILDTGYTTQYLTQVQLDNPPGIFKTYKINQEKIPYQGFPYTTGNVTNINLYGQSVEEIISSGESLGLKYISINPKGISPDFKFFDNVYENEEQYPYLKKIFDSNEHGFKKFKVKVFEIDYNKFHQMNKVDAK